MRGQKSCMLGIIGIRIVSTPLITPHGHAAMPSNFSEVQRFGEHKSLFLQFGNLGLDSLELLLLGQLAALVLE